MLSLLIGVVHFVNDGKGIDTKYRSTAPSRLVKENCRVLCIVTSAVKHGCKAFEKKKLKQTNIESQNFSCVHMGPCPLGPEELDGLLVPPGKASMLLTDHLITG